MLLSDGRIPLSFSPMRIDQSIISAIKFIVVGLPPGIVCRRFGAFSLVCIPLPLPHGDRSLVERPRGLAEGLLRLTQSS